MKAETLLEELSTEALAYNLEQRKLLKLWLVLGYRDDQGGRIVEHKRGYAEARLPEETQTQMRALRCGGFFLKSLGLLIVGCFLSGA